MSIIQSDTIEWILDQTCRIQQIPAPTFAEGARADYMLNTWQAIGLTELSRDATGNAYARLPGGRGRPLVVSAHLDTVHPASAALPQRRSPERLCGPGIGDNSVSLAVLLALGKIWAAEKTILPGDLWLVGNTAEEGLGNLTGMRGVVERFGAQPLAYLVLEGMGLGLVYHRGLGVNRYRISAETAGGHSWGDYGLPSAIHELAELITRLAHIPLSKRPRTTLNVGVIQGGTSVNTIAGRAWMELDLRSEDRGALDRLDLRVHQVVQQAEIPGVRFQMDVIGNRPAGELPSDHPLVRTAQQVLMSLGVKPILEIGSTDANLPLSLGYPSICIGLTQGNYAHTSEECIYTPPLKTGLLQVLRLIEQCWGLEDLRPLPRWF